jgi:hypothetical protein
MKEKKLLLILVFISFLHNASFSQNVIPSTDELVLPKYALGGTLGGAIANRLQFVCRLKLSGLNANTTYKFFSGASISATITTSNSPGWFFVINNISGTAGYITGYSSSKGMNGSLMSNNEFVNSTRYGEFTTDASGTYTGWFCCVGTTNASFIAGNSVYFYVQINNGAGGTTIYLSFRTTSTITILDYGTTSVAVNQASAVVGKSFANGEEIIVLYDNTSGTGRPFFVTFTENDGIITDWTTWYNSPIGPDGVKGRWGAILPNMLPNGLQRIERRGIQNNNLIDFGTSMSGQWGLVNTVNPSNGISPLIIDSIDAPLPIKLAYFNSGIEKNNVTLYWSTHQEINNKGFEIERMENENNWKYLSSVQGNGNCSTQKYYLFKDLNLISSTYKYRLKQIDFNGNFEYFNLSNDVVIGKPGELTLSQNYPNPSNPVTKIDYQIPFNGFVQIKIYNVFGQEIAHLYNGFIKAGYHSILFNCMNVSSGIYFYRIQLNADNKSLSKTMKMVVVK